MVVRLHKTEARYVHKISLKCQLIWPKSCVWFLPSSKYLNSEQSTSVTWNGAAFWTWNTLQQEKETVRIKNNMRLIFLLLFFCLARVLQLARAAINSIWWHWYFHQSQHISSDCNLFIILPPPSLQRQAVVDSAVLHIY